MDKAKVKKMYELFNRLQAVDTASLSQQQLREHAGMLVKLKEAMLGSVAVAAKDPGEYDQEGDMAHTQLKTIEDAAEELQSIISADENLPEWVQSKITKAMDYIDTARDYLKSKGHGSDEPVEEAEDVKTNYNIYKLGASTGVDPRMLRMAIVRGMSEKMTRVDAQVLAQAFLNLLQNSDDREIQRFANIVKTGNPMQEPQQESTAAIAERNAFVDALRQAKKGEKFTVGGREYTKTTDHGEDTVKETMDTEAYDRLKRVFDFSDFKG
jgi:hypothetical protein